MLKRLVKHIFFWSPRRCVCCGAHARPRQFPAIWEGLAAEWELTPEQHRQFDRREGSLCASCGASARVRQLTKVLLDRIARRTGKRYSCARAFARDPARPQLRVAEINEITGLHEQLRYLENVDFSDYGGENSQNLMALTYAGDTFYFVLTSDTLEHVPDFDLALREVHRVLKKGGQHIFTIPIIRDRKSRQRAEIVDGRVVHRLPPSYHGKPDGSAADYLVFHEFGGDVIERIERWGFRVRQEVDARNPALVTIIAEKP